MRLDPMSVHYFNEVQLKINSIQERDGDVIRLDIGSPDMPPLR
jgi:hypothetical protein